MRIAIVVGFFTPVRKALEIKYPDQISERSLIWVGQSSNGLADIRQFKSDFLDQIAQGATDFLICTPVNRRDLSALTSIEGIADAAKLRCPEVSCKLFSLKSAFETDALLSKIDEFQVSKERQFSGDKEHLEEWVLEQHSGRLVLHARAARGLRKSAFQDIPLVYAALDLLAREYRETKLTDPAQAAAKASRLALRLASLGLELTPSISESRAGEEGADYFVEFPFGSGKKFLDLHLKKGVAHDERLCLRIYFLWSAPYQKVVVGWMTTHLGTRKG